MTATDRPVNRIAGTVVGRGSAGVAVDVGAGAVLHVRGSGPAPGTAVVVAVAPGSLRLDADTGLENTVRARVVEAAGEGDMAVYRLETAGGLGLVAIEAAPRGRPRLAPGARVRVTWAAAETTLLEG